MVERITSQRLLEAETKQKSREVKDTQTLRMWCVEQAMSSQREDFIAAAHEIENYILGRVVS